MKSWSGMMLCALALSGCIGLGGGSPKTRFYTLQVEAAPAAAIAEARAGLVIALGPVKLPDVLNRPQIVTRDADHRLQFAEFDHWAGSLHSDVERVLTGHLVTGFPAARIHRHPWPAYVSPNLQLRIDVLRLEGRLGGSTLLEGTWSLIGWPRREELQFRHFRYEDAALSGGYPALAASYSRLLARLMADAGAQLAAHSAPADTD